MAVPISNVTRRQVYSPSGTGGAGPYSFTFEILANTDIAVYKDDTLLTLTTHYTVTINSNGTGSVTITAAGLALSPTSPTQYAIVGNRTIQRTTDFTTGGDFFANTINDELDQQTIFAQQNAEGLARALTAPQTDPTSINMTLPSKANRALKTLSFDVNGNPTPGVSAADVANATTYATNAANSATAAASSASSASSSASSASSSASTASTQASNASTSATNASNSASSASTSATNAAGSASTAATQASNASTSATNAASSASAASTSAANAATSATNASNSASTATTQASNAASSASSASGSATSAANSAAAAASALDSFDDRYLGTKSSDPTLDNDGNALAAGALYFSTSQNVMKVYDGASWITATSAGATSLLQFKYVATAGQTSFSGAATVGGTLTYTVNNIVVFLNGVALDSTDYTASTGTSVVLGTAAALNDELVIIAFKSFTVADTYTKGEVDGFAVKLTGNQTVAGTKTFSSEISAPNTFGFKNRIINGAMVIDQRYAGTAYSPANGFSVDRWTSGYYAPAGGTYSAQQVVDAPAGFYNSLKMTVTATPSSNTDAFFQLYQPIEANNVADFALGTASASSFAFSFWVKSSLTGTFCVAFGNNTSPAYYYISTYTINTANTWEFKTITVTAPTAGTWGTTNGQGLAVFFDLGSGTNQDAPSANTWNAGNYRRISSGVRLIGTNGATFYITGVQLEKGSTATSFDYRPYGTELALCQRYCYVMGRADLYNELGLGVCATTVNAQIVINLPVPMRTTPSAITTSGNFQVSDFFNAIPITGFSIPGSQNSPNILSVQASVAGGLTQFRPIRIESNNSTASYAIISTEL